MQSYVLPPPAVLPEQSYGSSIGAAHTSGVVALIRTVLDDASTCNQKQFCADGRRTQRLAKEAEAWLFSDDDRWPFAFVNVCGALAIEPDFVRRKLKQLRRMAPEKVGPKQHRATPVRRPLRIAA